MALVIFREITRNKDISRAVAEDIAELYAGFIRAGIRGEMLGTFSAPILPY